MIGASAIDEDGALLDFDYREVRVAQAIIDNARQVILVADRLKFERSAPVRIGHISQIDIFVTDELPSVADGRALSRPRRQVVEASWRHDPEGRPRTDRSRSRPAAFGYSLVTFRLISLHTLS